MIQLRLKTEYTFGRTFAPIARVIERLKDLGCTAAGIVDLNSTWGHIPWYKACKAAGILPLLGIEVTVSDDEADQRRMWFLAKTSTGLSELYRAISKSHRQPIATPVGNVQRLYRTDVRLMSDHILKFAGEITDPEFLVDLDAIIDLNPSSRTLNGAKLKIAVEHGLRIVDTSDNYFAYPDDSKAFEFASRGRLKVTPQYILDKLDRQDVAAGIASECAGLELPTAPMIRAEGNLEAICREGIAYRGMKWNEDYEDRLQYELGLIRSKNFESYFIIVADMVHYAKQHMLVGPSRGSAAGSLVCYTSRITEIDPMPPKLFFERFIDVTRTDLPDIDLDFPDDKRHMVFEYMADKYGVDNVAHIGTVAQFKPKSALIQVCKALRIAPFETNAVKTAMIERSIADARASNCLQDTFETTQPGRDFLAAHPQAAIAALLEGHASHTGTHAAGLLVCNEPITNYAVVDANDIAHVDKYAAEMLGLLKIDVLGLRTLSVLADADVDVDWYNLKFDPPDPKTMELFNSGRFCGLFQFEGNALRDLSKDFTFKGIREIDAITALARPGPFGSGIVQTYLDRARGAPYTSIHPKVAAIMEETYGLPLYQEHTLAIVREIGQFSWEETSFVRKAISKRQGKEFFQKFLPKFLEGAGSQGIPADAAEKVWELINAMGSWQMNKSHTYSYAVISYWTAYLKAHFPLEFAAANLRNAKDDNSAILLLQEMSREGFEYIPFDLEMSEENWAVKDGRLYGGFKALKGIGDAKAQDLVEARNAGRLTPKQIEMLQSAFNPFADIFPFKTKYGHMYRDPLSNGISGEVSYIVDLNDKIPHRHERVFIGELIHKSARNMNEEAIIKKTGKVEKDKLEFVDVRLRDDTDMIGGRISRWDYQRIGKELLEKVPVGSHLLVRAKFFNNIRYAFITKYKVLSNGNGTKPS